MTPTEEDSPLDAEMANIRAHHETVNGEYRELEDCNGKHLECRAWRI